MIGRLRAPRRSMAFGSLGAVVLIALSVVPAAAGDFPAKDSRYHNFTEMVNEIKAVEAAHPDIVDVFTLDGKSYQGRDIWAAKVSDNVATDEAEPEVLVDALHHAREHMSTEQALYLLRMLANGYGHDTTITNMVNWRETWIVFAVNPDGFLYDLTCGGSHAPYCAWRKNRQPNSGSSAIGTDLNRNYDYRWGCCGGSSGTKSSITYRGAKPWSAPETRAIRDFVLSRRVGGIQQIKTHVTLHTNGKLVLWPFGYTKTNRPSDMTALDYKVFVSMGKAMAAKNGYKPMQSSDLYITDGDQIDWMYGSERIFSFTWELYPPETSTVWGDHYPPDETIASVTANNKTALLYLISAAGCPYSTLSMSRQFCGPFFDDFEMNRGWQLDPDDTDTATTGAFHRGDPAPTTTSAGLRIQPDTAYSGRYALMTGLAGGSLNTYDLDGQTTVRSVPITVTGSATVRNLAFRYSFAHGPSSAEDSLKVFLEAEDGTRTQVWEKLGNGSTVGASWTSVYVDIASPDDRIVRIVFQATDGGPDSLVEIGLDDIRIERPVT